MRIDWRTIEAEAVVILLAEGYRIDDNPRTGDKYIEGAPEMNITAFAQALASRLRELEKVADDPQSKDVNSASTVKGRTRSP